MSRLRSNLNLFLGRPIVDAFGLPQKNGACGIQQLEGGGFGNVRFVCPGPRRSQVPRLLMHHLCPLEQAQMRPLMTRFTLRAATSFPSRRLRFTTPSRLARAMPPIPRTGIHYSVKRIVCRGSRNA